jgi:hypothetical protein
VPIKLTYSTQASRRLYQSAGWETATYPKGAAPAGFRALVDQYEGRAQVMENNVTPAWTHIDPDIQAGAESDPEGRQILYAVTREMAEELAGHPVTDEEAERIAKAILISSIPDALIELVINVCNPG